LFFDKLFQSVAIFTNNLNSIGGVMVIVLVSSAVDCVFAASPLSTQH